MKVLHTEWSDGWGGQEIRIIGEMEGVREKGIDVLHHFNTAGRNNFGDKNVVVISGQVPTTAIGTDAF